MKHLPILLLGCAAALFPAHSAEWPKLRPDRYEQVVEFKFPEPLVSQTAVHNGYYDDTSGLSDEDLGRDIFTITGDAQFKPTGVWRDQDTLRISFPVGTSCATEYRFRLNPGTTYLGGAEAPQQERVFFCPDDTLSGKDFMDDKGVGVVVSANHHLTRESRGLSPDSGLRFVFREAHWDEELEEVRYSTTVETTLEPACLKQGVTLNTLRILENRGEDVWKKLTPDTPLPGHVVVRPVSPLEPEKEWHLLLLPEKAQGFATADPVCELVPKAELGSGVEWVLHENKTCRLRVFFSEPMKAADLPGLFDRMQLTVGEQVASAAGDGKKQLMVNGQCLEFRYSGAQELPMVGPHWVRPGGDFSYTPKGLALGFFVEVSAPVPAVLDVVLPGDTKSALGWGLAAEHRHRIALNPAWPVLQYGEAVQVPLKGDHNLRLPYTNLDSVKVSAWRVAEDKRALAVEGRLSNSARVLARQLDCDMLDARRELGLEVNNSARSEDVNQLIRLRDEEKERAARSAAVLAGATPLPGMQHPAGAGGLLQSGEAVLPLDSATGGPVSPGTYLLRLQPVANAGVRSALQLHRKPAESLDSQQDVVVQVTDLNVAVGDAAILVNRFSDGSPVESGTVTYSDKAGARCQLTVQNGVAWLPEDSAINGLVEVRSGEDSVLLNLWHGKRRSAGSRGRGQSTMLVLDRPLYRPGDTINVRGILRHKLADGSCAIPAQKKAKLIFRAPNGENLQTREVSLGEFGAFEAQFQLPKGEDDVTGFYSIGVECGRFHQWISANCQVFRRDAFKATLELELDSVAPLRYSVRVSAVDYSGVPLAGADCFLNLENEQVELKLDAEGKASLTRELKEPLKERRDICVRGSVVNDREEYVRMPGVCKPVYPADFYVRNANGRVKLFDARTNKVLGREQQLNLKLIQHKREPIIGDNGLGKMEDRKVELWVGSMTVPANCELGLPLPFDAREKYPDADAWVISARDAEGRESTTTHPLWFFRPRAESPELKLEHKSGELELRCELPKAAQAHLFIGCAQKLRHLVLPVQAGIQTHRVPLQSGEEGTVSATLVLPPADTQNAPLVCHGECFVPISKYHLDVELNLPQQVCRPAETVTLSGRVLADGQPADAEVTLYAVDAGMLSVGLYEKPDPESFFCRGWSRRFSLTGAGAPYRRQRLVGEPGLMPGIWRGDLVGKGYSLTPASYGVYSVVCSAADGARLNRAATYYSKKASAEPVAVQEVAMDAMMDAATEEGIDIDVGIGLDAAPAPMAMGAGPGKVAGGSEMTAPRLRTDFAPVAVWKGALRADADGCFSSEVELPDTLTSYRVFAVALDKSGKRFGSASGEFTVAQPVMLTPGTPLFMSLGDELRLPLSIVNNTDEAGTWTVTLEGAAAPQQITLAAHGQGTLYFPFKAASEGEQKLRWTALGKPGSDAVQGEFEVRFPAPVLKEVHRLAISAGDSAQSLAVLLGTDVASATRGRVELQVSANPLLHLAGAADFLLTYPYGCTEQRASALIPWLLYDHLAPFCPLMAGTSPEEVKNTVKEIIAELLNRQCKDGGLAYWAGQRESCLWASAHAACVLKLAQEQGYEVPEEKLENLLQYLWTADTSKLSAMAQFCLARTRGESEGMKSVLRKSLEKKDACLDRESRAGMQFILSLLTTPAEGDAAFRSWMRTVGRDYRHGTTQRHAWTLLALAEYLNLRKNEGGEATLVLQDGTEIKLDKGSTTVPLPWQAGQEMKTLPATLAAKEGTVYATFSVRALPVTTDYPGVTECGLQLTRLYETRGADGVWRPATSFKVGDVVRVTLTCAKVADELKYLVLEDYLPACMEAINPNVPGQSAGLEPTRWSFWFDHREYLADRVRGFCTRWEGRDLLNMQYYARVKRAGTSAAPPAQAQLMYEPQVYGLSPNTRIVSEP